MWKNGRAPSSGVAAMPSWWVSAGGRHPGCGPNGERKRLLDRDLLWWWRDRPDEERLHRLFAEVATGDEPFVILLCEDGADEASWGAEPLQCFAKMAFRPRLKAPGQTDMCVSSSKTFVVNLKLA